MDPKIIRRSMSRVGGEEFQVEIARNGIIVSQNGEMIGVVSATEIMELARKDQAETGFRPGMFR